MNKERFAKSYNRLLYVGILINIILLSLMYMAGRSVLSKASLYKIESTANYDSLNRNLDSALGRLQKIESVLSSNALEGNYLEEGLSTQQLTSDSSSDIFKKIVHNRLCDSLAREFRNTFLLLDPNIEHWRTDMDYADSFPINFPILDTNGPEDLQPFIINKIPDDTTLFAENQPYWFDRNNTLQLSDLIGKWRICVSSDKPECNCLRKVIVEFTSNQYFINKSIIIKDDLYNASTNTNGILYWNLVDNKMLCISNQPIESNDSIPYVKGHLYKSVYELNVSSSQRFFLARKDGESYKYTCFTKILD